MTKPLLIALTLFLTACAASPPAHQSTTPEKSGYDVARLLKEPAQDEQSAPSEAPAPQDQQRADAAAEGGAQYRMTLPTGWQFGKGEDGSVAALHVSGNPPEVDAVVQISGAANATVAAKAEEGHTTLAEQLKDRVSAVTASADGDYAYFDIAPPANNAANGTAGRIIIRNDPGKHGVIIGTGMWQGSHHDRYAADALELMRSIAVSDSTAAVAPDVSAEFRPVEAAPVAAPHPQVATPQGWQFDASTGQCTKADGDAKPIARCTFKMVPIMGLTVAQHRDMFMGAIRTKNDPHMTIRGDGGVSADGNRAMFLTAFFAGEPLEAKADGVVVIRKAAGLDGAYLLCMGSWKPGHDEILSEAEHICDTFAIVSDPASAPH